MDPVICFYKIYVYLVQLDASISRTRGQVSVNEQCIDSAATFRKTELRLRDVIDFFQEFIKTLKH